MIDWQLRADGGYDAYHYLKFRSKKLRMWYGTVRPAVNAGGLADSTRGWVCSGHSFDDLVHFDTLTQAKLHIEAIAALNAT